MFCRPNSTFGEGKAEVVVGAGGEFLRKANGWETHEKNTQDQGEMGKKAGDFCI